MYYYNNSNEKNKKYDEFKNLEIVMQKLAEVLYNMVYAFVMKTEINLHCYNEIWKFFINVNNVLKFILKYLKIN